MSQGLLYEGVTMLRFIGIKGYTMFGVIMIHDYVVLRG
jgi:hypothetical protein